YASWDSWVFPLGTSPYIRDSARPSVVAPSSVLAADIGVVHMVADIAAVDTVVDHIAVADIAVVVDTAVVAGYKVVGYTVMTVQYSLVAHTEIVFDKVAAVVVLVDVVPTG